MATKKLEREWKREEQYKEEKGIEKRYSTAADLLEDIWLNIDWDNVDPRRRMKIWSEFEGQVKALSRCYSRLEPFIDKLCRRFGSCVYKYQTREILKEGNDKKYLDIFRNETQIPMLLLKLRREKIGEDYKKKKKTKEALQFTSNLLEGKNEKV